MTFYERLEMLRKSKKISQGDLEKELGFSNGSISKWKKSQPTFDRLKKLADYFEVTVEYLLNGETVDEKPGYYINEKTAVIAQNIFENKQLRALFDVQCDMDPDDLEALHNMALALKRKERGDDDA